MSQEKKYAKINAIINKREQDARKSIKVSYEDVYREIKEFIRFWTDKLNGPLTASEMYKYNRYNNLVKEIEGTLKNLEMLKAGKLNKYVLDQYETSYFGSGYVLETEWQQKLNYRVLDRNRLLKSVQNPMAKVSLANQPDIVRQQLVQAITSSINLGEGINEASARVKKALGKNANNAYRIYQTETTRVNNEANIESMEKAQNYGLNIKKKWIATLDDRTRNSHKHLDGQVRPVGQTFSNGLMYPGDPEGPPGEVINCRCTMITEVDGYKDANQYRRARGLDGKNKVIPYTTYEEWEKNRVKQ